MSGCAPAPQAGLVGVLRARSARESPSRRVPPARRRRKQERAVRCRRRPSPAEPAAQPLQRTSSGIPVGAQALETASRAPSRRTCLVAVAMVEVKIRSVDGTTDTVSVDDLSSTIRDVKLAIEAAKSYPVETQRLVFRGKVLQDDKTLAEYCERAAAARGWHRRPRGPALSPVRRARKPSSPRNTRALRPNPRGAPLAAPAPLGESKRSQPHLRRPLCGSLRGGDSPTSCSDWNCFSRLRSLPRLPGWPAAFPRSLRGPARLRRGIPCSHGGPHAWRAAQPMARRRVGRKSSRSARAVRDAISPPCALRARSPTRAPRQDQALRDVCPPRPAPLALSCAAAAFEDGATMHLVRSKPAAAPATSTTPAPGAYRPAAAAPGRFGVPAAPPSDTSSMGGMMRAAQSMMRNPEAMRQMMESPMVQSMMSNPDMMRSMAQSNPQLRELMERRPELRAALSDPETMRQAMRAAMDPRYAAELNSSTDRAMASLEAHPAGMRALQRMWSEVAEPL